MNTPETSHPETSTPEFSTPVRASTRVQRTREILTDETGAATAEYVVVVLAAVAFAGVLIAIIRSSEVQAMLLDIVQRALGQV